MGKNKTTSLRWSQRAAKVLEENEIMNVSAFASFLIEKWGDHLKKSGGVLIESLCRDLDIYVIYDKKVEELRNERDK